MLYNVISAKEKELLALLGNGPTLLQLARRIHPELGEEASVRVLRSRQARRMEAALIALEKKGYAFTEEGRWWRTPEGVNALEATLVGIDEDKHAEAAEGLKLRTTLQQNSAL